MDDSPSDNPTQPTLGWEHVFLGLCFVLADALASAILGLGISTSLLTSAARCIIQLTLMSYVLGAVFETQNPWAVAGIAVLLNLLGAYETTFNKAKRRHDGLFFSTFISMISSTIPIAILSSRFAMAHETFWDPPQFIPTLGMICGNAISAMAVALNFTLKEFTENRDKIETLLAHGASRFEACRPIARDALKLALLPTINQMSVIGLISIPGMMAGSVLAGASVQQAARLQMIIIMTIAASSTLAAAFTLLFALLTLIDSSHRIRADRVVSSRPWAYRAVDTLVERGVKRPVRAVGAWVRRIGRRKGEGAVRLPE